MNEIQKALFINCMIAEEAYKESLLSNGKASPETEQKGTAYTSLLQVIKDSGEYESYRGFRIMVVLRSVKYVKEGTVCRQIPA